MVSILAKAFDRVKSCYLNYIYIEFEEYLKISLGPI